MIKFNKITTGAGNDFERATELIKNMVTKYGMYMPYSPTVYILDRDKTNCLSEHKRLEIETFIEKILAEMFNNVINILERSMDELTLLAESLYTNEYISYDDIKKLLPGIESTYIIKDE